MAEVPQYIVTGILNGGIYALIGLGIVLIYKASSIFNFSIGAMICMSAYFLYAFLVQLGLPVGASIVLCIITSILLGMLLERGALRPLIGQPLLSSVLVTLALSYLLTGIVTGAWGSYQYKMPEIFPGGAVFIGKVTLAHDLLWCFGIAVALFAALAIFYQRTHLGLSMRATAESHIVAQARGINVSRVLSFSWAFCGLIAGAAGLLLGYRVGVSQFVAGVAFKAFPVVLFGGLESIIGCLIGGLVVGVLESLAGGLVASWLMEPTPYIILLFVLIFRPEGLFGLKRIERI